MVQRSLVHRLHVKRENLDSQLAAGLISETEHAIAVLDLEAERHHGSESFDWDAWSERMNAAIDADDAWREQRLAEMVAEGTLTEQLERAILG